MKKTGSFAMVAAFMSAYPGRSALMVFCLLLAGFFEGVGIASLLPLLNLVLAQESTTPSALEKALSDVFSIFGLDPTLPLLLVIITIVMILKSVFTLIAMKQVGYTVAHIVTELRLAMLRGLFRARWSYFIRQPIGVFTNAVSTEAIRLSKGYHGACLLMSVSIQVLFYMVIALLLSWQITAASLAGGVMIAFLLIPLMSMARRAGKKQTESFQVLLVRLTDLLKGIKPIKAMGRIDQLGPLLEAESIRLKSALRQKVLSQELLKALQEPLIVILMSSGLFLAFTYRKEGMADFFMLAVLFYRILTRMGSIQKQYQDLGIFESAYWSFQKRLNEIESVGEEVTGDVHPSFDQAIRFDNVTFFHGDKEIFRNVSLEIPQGSLVAITGESGVGKTTLVDLISGLITPQQGRVLVDGVPLRRLNTLAWRKQIGYVPQEMFLFHDTVLNNVTLGDRSVSRQEAEDALHKAGAWDFVSALSEGLDTEVGEGGTRFSGGQRQRISLARALVNRPRLLILDEMTTSLDPMTETAICETLLQLLGKMGIVAISHQQALVLAADKVLRVSGGDVVEVEASYAANIQS